MWFKQLISALFLITSAFHLLAQQVDSIGANVVVNLTTLESQQNPVVAMDADGDYVVVWESQDQDGSGYGIFARCYDRWGDPISGEVQVNTNTVGDQRAPDVAMDEKGDFVVVWMDDSNAADNWNVYSRRFTCGCAPKANPARANSSTAGHQKFPKVDLTPAGNYTIVWNKAAIDGSAYSIRGRRFLSNGAAIEAVQLYSDAETSTLQTGADIAIDESGNFNITWQGVDADGGGIIAARFNSSGVKQGSDFQVNSTEANNQSDPVIGMSSTGEFQIAWTSYGQDGDDEGVYAQRFNSAGGLLGGEIQVASTTLNGQYDPSIATTQEGNFTIAWSMDGIDGSYDGIYLRSYQADGTPITGEERPSTRSTDFQQSSALAHYGSAQDMVVTWQDGLNNSTDTRDSSNYGVFQQRYFVDAGDNPTYSGTIYVDAGASGNNRGSTWTNAFEDLQEALRYTTIYDIDSIFVAEGTYLTRGATGVCYGSYNESPFDHFNIPGGISLIGSYPTGGGAFEERNVMNTPSILSGDIGLPGDSTDNSYNVVRTVNLNDSLLVDGFVITEGNGIPSPGTNLTQAGGAWLNWNNDVNSAYVEARNCRMIGNSSQFTGGMVNYCTEGTLTVILTNCSISGNDCINWAAAMFNLTESGIGPSLLVDMTNCTVTGNRAGIRGGGIGLGQGIGTLTINFSNGIISGNTAPSHAEVYNFYNTGSFITNYSLVSTDSSQFCGIVDSGATCGPGMLFGLDPLFVDPDGADNIVGTLDDDLTLDNCSPAEDAGSNAYLPGGTLFDLAGDQRIIRDIVDMGVFENQNPNEYEVTSTADSGAGSLRQAILDACIRDTITFDEALMGQTIILTGAELTLDRDLYILGLGIDDLTISGNYNARVASVSQGTSFGIEALTLTGGISATDGGAIINFGNLSLKDIKFIANLNAVERRSITNFGDVLIGPGVLMLK